VHEQDLTLAADAWAAQLCAADPRSTLCARGIGLHAHARSLEARGRRIHGAWDPVLRRIELFGLSEVHRSDHDWVHTLAHESFHALTGQADETRAGAFAARFMSLWDGARVRTCAAALRQLACPVSNDELYDHLSHLTAS
jgi:hypothetical protein